MLLRRIGKPVLALVAVPVLRRDTGRRKPVGPLPARYLAKAGPVCREPLVQGRLAHAAGGLELPIGPVHGVEQAQHFLGPLVQIARVALKGGHAPDVHVPQIHGRVPFDDPFRQHLARPPGRLDTDRVEARRHEKVAQLRRLAEQVAVVRREALRAVEEGVDTRGLQHRHAVDRPFQHGQEVVVVRR